MIYICVINQVTMGHKLLERIRHIRGNGIHSPFVYDLITKVIEDRWRYYCFDDIELVRKKFMLERTVGNVVRQEGIAPKHGALLFRLTNYFRPKNILQVGSTVGLSTLYLTSYARGLNCISLETVPEYTDISLQLYEEAAKTLIDVRTGELPSLLPQALADMEVLDFAYFNLYYEQTDYLWLFKECTKHTQASTVFVFEGIRDSRRMRECWAAIVNDPEVTVTIDLRSMGIVFFNPKLHKRCYKVCF